MLNFFSQFTQAAPLLLKEDTGPPIRIVASDETILSVKLPQVRVAVYDENEETTCVEFALLLTSDCISRWFLVPLLSLLSCLIFPLFLYWKIPLQRDWLY